MVIYWLSKKMNARNLFVIAITVSSAALGAGIAVITNLPERVAVLPSQVAQIVSPQGSQVVPPQLPPANLTTQATQAESAEFALPQATTEPLSEASSPDEFDQLKSQLRRAIRQRDSVLLRSLMRVGSLREALRNVAVTEQGNFENLDASTWTVLEKAIDYRCHQQMTQLGKDGKGCFD